MSVESAFSNEHLLQILRKLAHYYMNYSQKWKGLFFYETHCIWSVLLCGCETWTVSKTMKNGWVVIEICFLRRMLRAWGCRRLRTKVIGKYRGVQHMIIKTIRNSSSQLNFLGHVMGRHGLENLEVIGNVEERRARGHQNWIFRVHNMITWAQQSSSGLQKTECSGITLLPTSSTIARQPKKKLFFAVNGWHPQSLSRNSNSLITVSVLRLWSWSRHWS